MEVDRQDLETAKLAAGYPLTTYNAGKLSPRQVAESFVSPTAFEQIVTADNALLIGPRGSGKTTLLKMLHSEALENWDDPQAERFRARVQSPGVFVGVDKMWNEQLNALGPPGAWLSNAAYALHIGKSLCRSMNHRLHGVSPKTEGTEHLRVKMTAPQEEEVAHLFSRAFGLTHKTSSLRSTATEFSLRIADLGAMRSALGQDSSPQPWVAIEPLAASVAVIERFNELANEPDRRWSLLFDELELAPEDIVRNLLRRLRGSEELLVYKLSLSPINAQIDLLRGELGAIHAQDAEHIPLTSAHRRDPVDFTYRLFAHHLNKAFPHASMNPRRLLGQSLFDESDEIGLGGDQPGGSNPYEAGSSLWQMFQDLSQSDLSFSKYLASHRIDLDDISTLSSTQRAATIRKIRNIVVVRSYFTKNGRGRSRKSYELYAGASSMLAIPDGNPRMATAMISDLISSVHPGQRTISRAVQGRAVDVVTQRFMALLLAQEAIQVEGEFVGLVDFLDAVGGELRKRILERPFSADIAMLFTVDKGVDSRLLPLVEHAVNTGAVINVPKDDPSSISETTVGRQYRLSYLLSPRYNLPIRMGKSISLSALLSNSSLLKGSRTQRRKRLLHSELEVFAIPEDADES